MVLCVQLYFVLKCSPGRHLVAKYGERQTLYFVCSQHYWCTDFITSVDVKNGRNPCNQPIDKNMNNPNDNEGGCDEDDHVDGEDNIIYDDDDYGNGEDLYSPFLTPH